MSLPNSVKPKFNYLPFRGGYDTETPPWNMEPGMVRTAQNYEVGINGGYQDIKGYERYDGSPAPSDAIYYTMDVTISGSIVAGDTITGASSGATGVVIAVDTETNTPQTYVAFTKITGSFNTTENLQVSAVTEGNTDASEQLDGAPTPALRASYLNLAADEYRDDISKPSGSGAIRGIYRLNDVTYVFRDNPGGDAVRLFKSSSSGWSQIQFGRELSFTSGGTYEIAEGDTITGQTSTETAEVTRVVLESGDWSTGDAAGRLILENQTGDFVSELLDVGANADVATIAADSDEITLDTGGRFEMVSHNFGGDTGEERIYGADGVNRGFEFDGEILVPIDTGMTADTPLHVIVHKQHLFFSFDGSCQHSGLSTPYIWSVVQGASELSTGEPITGFQAEPGKESDGALGIFGRHRIHILYGTSSADWNLVQYRDEVGAYAYSIQQLGTTMFFDDRGITNLETVQAYGNFQYNTLSHRIQRYVNSKRSLVKSSVIVRDKNQYRVFFDDNSGLHVTMAGTKITGMMPIQLDHTVECTYSLEANDGTEIVMFGGEDGMVYQMERGTSFDGGIIDGTLVLHFHWLGSLRQLKKFLGVAIEASGTTYAEFSLSYELGYAASNINQPGVSTTELSFAAAQWDISTWDVFYWDGISLTPSNHKLSGSGENISLLITKSSDEYEPIIFSGANFRYIDRRQLR